MTYRDLIFPIHEASYERRPEGGAVRVFLTNHDVVTLKMLYGVMFIGREDLLQKTVLMTSLKKRKGRKGYVLDLPENSNWVFWWVLGLYFGFILKEKALDDEATEAEVNIVQKLYKSILKAEAADRTASRTEVLSR